MTKPAESRRYLVTALGILVSLGLLAWVLKGVSFEEVIRHLRAARPGPLVAAVVLATLTFGVRTLRWRILLRREDGGPVGWIPLWHATAMGFMANNTLPFRLGELLRSYAASRLGRVPLASAFSSIAVERALDALVLVGLLIAALAGAGLPATTTIAGARLDVIAQRTMILAAVIFAGALFVVLFPTVAERMVRAVVPFRGLADRLVRLIEGLRLGFGALRSPTRLGAAVLWSIGLWLLNGAAFHVAFAAFDLQVGFAGALLLQSLIAFGIAAPSTPGYFGVFEAVTAACLALFGVPAGAGFAYGITFHITTFIPITLLGLWSLTRTGLHVRDVAAPPA